MPEPHVPPPDPYRGPLKVNVFERMIGANVNPMPLFPYDGPGALLIAGAIMSGGHGGLGTGTGALVHANTQQEISLLYGAVNLPASPGQITVNEREHGNRGAFGPDNGPRDGAVLTLIQRQAEDGDPEQREAIRYQCDACDRLLYEVRYRATPGDRPLEDGVAEPAGDDDDRYGLFPTVWGSAVGAERFSSDRALRTCPDCGHVNEPFSATGWGWSSWVSQHRTANLARSAMLAAARQEAIS